MNCIEFRNRMADLLAGDTPGAEEREHLESCPACAADYAASRRALNAVTPRHAVPPSENLRERILAAASTPTSSALPVVPWRRWLGRAAGALSAAAAVALIVIVTTFDFPAHASKRYFGNAVASMSELRTLKMELRIRTLPQENFSYTDPSLDFVPHSVTVEYGDTLRWRVEKSGRVALNDGRRLLVWMPNVGEGFFYPSADWNVTEDLSILLDPRLLMLAEQRLATHTQGAAYRIDEEETAVKLRVMMPAQGDFRRSDYALDSSIGETNTLREYRFDKTSGRLLEVRITALLPGGNRIVLLESDRIACDEPVDREILTACPEGIDWIDLSAVPSGTRLAGISAREAATRILTAMTAWDESLLDEALCYYGPSARETLKSTYKGVAIVSVDRPVRSGTYAGVFVPCKVLLADGSRDKLMLALRKDNPEKVWIVDGGL